MEDQYLKWIVYVFSEIKTKVRILILVANLIESRTSRFPIHTLNVIRERYYLSVDHKETTNESRTLQVPRSSN